jgi:hypothetical protein
MRLDTDEPILAKLREEARARAESNGSGESRNPASPDAIPVSSELTSRGRTGD